MQCSYFDAHQCRSCSEMGTPYSAQLEAKDHDARVLLSQHTSARWLAPVASQESAFRNKAKIVVAGSVERPTLGIVARDGTGIDLSGCGIYDPQISAMMPVLRDVIQRAGLTPYNIVSNKGELKSILVSVSPQGEAMVRFVLRSKKLIVPIRREIPRLSEEISGLKVVSVNLLREHVALVEGDEEIILTEQQTLPMQLGKSQLHLRPQSFFQTNTEIAQALYDRGQQWVEQTKPASVWDLYCGVGGFAVHAAQVLPSVAHVRGVEISSEAITSAQRTAQEAGLENVDFVAADATEFALSSNPEEQPELLIVNPPRRGIGEKLSTWIQSSSIQTVIYSSCNAKSLAKDLANMPSFELVQAQVLDMFPQTRHYEVICLLQRRRTAE